MSAQLADCQPKIFKIAVLGDAVTDKNDFLRFLKNQSTPQNYPDHRIKQIIPCSISCKYGEDDHRNVGLYFWHIPLSMGDKRKSRALEDSDAALILYDSAKPETIEIAKKEYQELIEVNELTPALFIGAKSETTTNDKSYKVDLPAPIFMYSNIDEIFEQVYGLLGLDK